MDRLRASSAPSGWRRAIAGAFIGIGLAISPVRAAEPNVILYKQPQIAITNVQLIDGTGGAAQANVTVLIKDGRITSAGPASRTKIPAQAKVVDGHGKTLIPGLVFMHEHMFYPVGQGHFSEMLQSFPPLYLAGGVTTARTGGTLSPYADINLREAIKSGSVIGPDLDVTGPYIEAVDLPVLKIRGLADADEAERFVNYWADSGATSFKAYMLESRAILKRAIDTAHKRGTKITGHLCSVTYREAARLGIDNLEHGFAVMTDFVKDKRPDVCPLDQVDRLIDNVDPASAEVKSLIDHLVAHKVAITSTLATFEDLVPGRPRLSGEARSVLLPEIARQYDEDQASLAKDVDALQAAANFRKMMTLERMFVAAGGLLMAGSDPTGLGGAVPGFASKRQLELLVEAGFSIEEAVKIGTLNGARYLGRDADIGSIEVGKRADLILIDGDPKRDPAAFERILIVFKSGVGYDSDALIKQARGLVGLR